MKPHKVIWSLGGPYLRRWHIIPRNPWLNLYLHHFIGDDDSRALHDHPWWNLSVIIRGRYWEVTEQGVAKHNALSAVFRRPTDAHRIMLDRNPDGTPRPAWTMFLTGPRVREWGFHCPKGWRRWQDFVDPNNPNKVGPGCD